MHQTDMLHGSAGAGLQPLAKHCMPDMALLKIKIKPTDATAVQHDYSDSQSHLSQPWQGVALLRFQDSQALSCILCCPIQGGSRPEPPPPSSRFRFLQGSRPCCTGAALTRCACRGHRSQWRCRGGGPGVRPPAPGAHCRRPPACAATQCPVIRLPTLRSLESISVPSKLMHAVQDMHSLTLKFLARYSAS